MAPDKTVRHGVMRCLAQGLSAKLTRSMTGKTAPGQVIGGTKEEFGGLMLQRYCQTGGISGNLLVVIFQSSSIFCIIQSLFMFGFTSLWAMRCKHIHWGESECHVTVTQNSVLL